MLVLDRTSILDGKLGWTHLRNCFESTMRHPESSAFVTWVLTRNTVGFIQSFYNRRFPRPICRSTELPNRPRCRCGPAI
ncbi:unnamed protein product [Nesidiocoris tenuis]|uniref:Uncharacterized protein n=1 Tax=Nesidiocoris tenuis TaxID=355587 RepID=A0A6H5GQP3_9HEMI|nr:unnamed protein product [Nesidiocoris tenuis]